MRTPRVALVAVVGALALAVLAGACTPKEGPVVHRSPSPSGVRVPALVGLDTRHADRALRRVGLLLGVEPVGGTTNEVESQVPLAGTFVDPGSTVTVKARCFAAPCPFPGNGKQIYDPCTCAAA